MGRPLGAMVRLWGPGAQAVGGRLGKAWRLSPVGWRAGRNRPTSPRAAHDRQRLLLFGEGLSVVPQMDFVLAPVKVLGVQLLFAISLPAWRLPGGANVRSSLEPWVWLLEGCGERTLRDGWAQAHRTRGITS